MRVRSGLRRPRLSWAGLVALAPLGAFAGFALVAALGAYRAADEARLRDTARALAAAADAQLGSYVAALETLASSPLLDGPMNAAGFELRARSVGERLGGWIVLIDQPPAYQMLANTRREAGVTLPSALPVADQAALLPAYDITFTQGRPAISDLFPGALAGRQTLAVLVPVDRPGQPRRALALGLEPAAFQRLLARQELPGGTFAAIADGQLRILAHSFDPEGQRVGARAPGWVEAAMRDRQRTLVIGPGWSGQDNVYAVERLKLVPGWTVTVAEPLAGQQASAWAALRWLLAGGAALGLGLAVVIWASRRAAVDDATRQAEALRAGRAEVERLLGGLPAVIFLREVAPDGASRPLYRGGDLETVMGWPGAELAARQNFEELIHPDDPTLAQEMPRLLRDGQISYEWRMRQPGGGWRRLHTLARVLTRQPDGSAEIVGYTVDVNALREAQARAVAGARLASLGELAAGLAHEIKQPLQTIAIAAEAAQLAARQGDVTQLDRRLERIVEQAERTAELVDRLRRFARGAEDTTPGDAVPLALAVQGALDLAHSALQRAAISVKVALGAPSPVVRGHRLLLEQVLSNLLLNARDALATRPAGVARQIRIAAQPVPGGLVRLTVADTGGGIAPEVLARLFEPFVTTKAPDQGTGLGLSICRGLITAMGGTIAAHNEGAGAVLTVTLRNALAQDVASGQQEPRMVGHALRG